MEQIGFNKRRIMLMPTHQLHRAIDEIEDSLANLDGGEPIEHILLDQLAEYKAELEYRASWKSSGERK